MAVETVSALTELTSPAANDEIGIWDVSAGEYKKIQQSNLVGATITGGGTIALGGYTLTVPATGTAALLATGSWTPTIAGSTVAGSHTYAVQNGAYWKIGTMVFVRADVAISNKDSGMSGNVLVSGLPFSVAASPKYTTFPVVWLSLATNYVSVAGLAIVGQSNVGIYGATAAAASLSILAASAVGNSTEFIISGWYETT